MEFYINEMTLVQTFGLCNALTKQGHRLTREISSANLTFFEKRSPEIDSEAIIYIEDIPILADGVLCTKKEPNPNYDEGIVCLTDGVITPEALSFLAKQKSGVFSKSKFIYHPLFKGIVTEQLFWEIALSSSSVYALDEQQAINCAYLGIENVGAQFEFNDKIRTYGDYINESILCS